MGRILARISPINLILPIINAPLHYQSPATSPAPRSAFRPSAALFTVQISHFVLFAFSAVNPVFFRVFRVFRGSKLPIPALRSNRSPACFCTKIRQFHSRPRGFFHLAFQICVHLSSSAVYIPRFSLCSLRSLRLTPSFSAFSAYFAVQNSPSPLCGQIVSASPLST